MKRQIFLIALFVTLGFSLNAQVGLVGYVEYGYSMFNYKSDELPVFLESYNNYWSSTLSEPFKTKMGMATGDYFKFGAGIGGQVMMVVDFTIYKTKTNPLEARYADKSGRDIWAEHRVSLSDIGIRVGGTKEVPVFAQFDMDLGIQVDYLYSAYVFPDGSRSIGLDHDLNGVYSSFVMTAGTGLTVGYRLGPASVNVSANYLGNFDRKHPEYHQYDDNNDVKPTMTPDYLPRDMTTYVTDPYNAVENSISDDFRGWKFTIGLTAILGNWKRD